MKKNKRSIKDHDDLINLIDHMKDGDDFLKEKGKVFVPCILKMSKPPQPDWEEGMEGNITERTTRTVDDQLFAEFAPYCYSLFTIMKKNKEWAEILSTFGEMACLTELAARKKERPGKFVYINEVKFAVISDSHLLFRCDEFLPYIMIDAKGQLRDYMDESIEEGKKMSEKRLMKVEYQGKEFYAWDLVTIAIVGAPLAKFQKVDLEKEEEIREWYSNMAKAINDMVHNTQDILQGIAGFFDHL